MVEVAWGNIALYLIFGLSLFLYGMLKMTDGLDDIAGDRMKAIFEKFVSNPIAGLFTGVVVTALIQSSSVTTVLLVGFVEAGLITITQSIGVILGADIGTTITSYIISLKITSISTWFVITGVWIILIFKHERAQAVGKLILGLGFIFFGMNEMGDAMRPLRDHQGFIDMMKNASNPLIGVAVAALFTGIIQSSAATMGLVITLATQGFIDVEGGVALALGAGIGTCATAGLACIGKSRAAVRVAVAHVGFKIAGVLIWIGFIPTLVELSLLVSPADNLSLQIVNAYMIFNMSLTPLFLPFTKWIGQGLMIIIPDKEEEEKSQIEFPEKKEPLTLKGNGQPAHCCA